MIALLTNAVVARAVELLPDACVVAVDEAPAVKSPVKAALETGTNWSLVMPLKESAGVMLIGDSTKGNA